MPRTEGKVVVAWPELFKPTVDPDAIMPFTRARKKVVRSSQKRPSTTGHPHFDSVRISCGSDRVEVCAYRNGERIYLFGGTRSTWGPRMAMHAQRLKQETMGSGCDKAGALQLKKDYVGVNSCSNE